MVDPAPDGAPRHVLVISGLDPSGGAGFIADVRVAEQHGCRAVGAITALTEQDSRGVRAVHPMSPAELMAVLTTLLSDVEVHAVKLGMLATAEHAEAIGEALALTRAPVVWDPILLPTRGRVPLLVGDLRRVVAALVPHVTLVTPNLDETAVLAGGVDQDPARILTLGFPAVLVKGGHASGPADDRLITAAGVTVLAGSRVPLAEPVHGTGCALATSIACRLAHGDALLDACRAGKAYVTARVTTPTVVGRGRPAVV